MNTNKATAERAEIDRLITLHTGLRESASPKEFSQIRCVVSAMLLHGDKSEVPEHARTEVAVVCAVKAFIKANSLPDGPDPLLAKVACDELLARCGRNAE